MEQIVINWSSIDDDDILNTLFILNIQISTLENLKQYSQISSQVKLKVTAIFTLRFISPHILAPFLDKLNFLFSAMEHKIEKK